MDPGLGAAVLLAVPRLDGKIRTSSTPRSVLMFDALQEAVAGTQIPSLWLHPSDQITGAVLLIIDGHVAPTSIVGTLVDEIDAALATVDLRCQMALSHGVATYADGIWTGRTVETARQLVSTPKLDGILEKSYRSRITLIVSDSFHRKAIRSGLQVVDPSVFAPVTVAAPDGVCHQAWVRAVGYSWPPGLTADPSPAAASESAISSEEPRPALDATGNLASLRVPTVQTIAMSSSSIPEVPRNGLGMLTELGRGGQGKVYDFAAPSHALPISGYADLLYKEYDPQVRRQLRVADLVTQVLSATRVRELGLGARLAWPLAIVTDGSATSGFLMQRAPWQFTVNLQMPRGPERKLGEFQFALNGPAYSARMRLPLTDRWRVLVLGNIADGLAVLHRQRIVVGDLSPKNLLVSFTGVPECFFLDCDGMQIGGRSALEQVETTDWEIPQGEPLATVHSDAYKFALLVTRLFAQSQESRDVAHVASFDRTLGDLARRGLSTDSALRPLPEDWIPALASAVPKA